MDSIHYCLGHVVQLVKNQSCCYAATNIFLCFSCQLIFQISPWSNVFVEKKVMCAIKQQPPYIHLVEISYRNVFVSNSKLEVSDIIISPGVLSFPPTVNINRKKNTMSHNNCLHFKQQSPLHFSFVLLKSKAFFHLNVLLSRWKKVSFKVVKYSIFLQCVYHLIIWASSEFYVALEKEKQSFLYMHTANFQAISSD